MQEFITIEGPNYKTGQFGVCRLQAGMLVAAYRDGLCLELKHIEQRADGKYALTLFNCETQQTKTAIRAGHTVVWAMYL